MPHDYFTSERAVETIAVQDVVAWSQSQDGSRLLLPPIQRSAVWRNAQIINYWDSLLRGYPAGLMLVHKSRAQSLTLDGVTTQARDLDFDLFDGQQRLTTLLLGYGVGQLHSRLRLWVDLGESPIDASGLLFQLRISSSGQPFGYRADSPNDKPPLGERAKCQTAWAEKYPDQPFQAKEVFLNVTGPDLISARCAVPLAQAVSLVISNQWGAVKVLTDACPSAPPDRIQAFVQALTSVLRQSIIFQRVDARLIEHEKDYVRYFARLGQGGTRLTDDELTYSIIKLQYPQIRDRMREIMEGPAGRIAGEVDLVLAALRVAKVTSGWDGGVVEWKIMGRPSPDFVSELKQPYLAAVLEAFHLMIAPPPDGLLKLQLETIRTRLEYHPSDNPAGLPRLLLARLPHSLVDVLLLRQTLEQFPGYKTANQPDLLPPFVLFWLLFVADSDKAAWLMFRRHLHVYKTTGLPTIPALVRELQSEGASRVMPRPKELDLLRNEVVNGNYHLRSWAERFTGADAIDERKPGEALRVLTCDRELSKRALLWLQRDYLATNFPDFDPTSNRDEDLPVDLDHLVPESKFGFHWKSRGSYINLDHGEENFRHHRGLVGNSLGNFRWLDASTNRGRGNRELEPMPNNADLISEPEIWNKLITQSPWTVTSVAEFQRLIDLRSIDLIRKLLEDSRLDVLDA